ncbi:hypothetical protein, partial [Rubellimicrobium mesophilum]|uniref:hypothetical protein n=1 Tax=Rubellimicrobium mesophilum TaxID=1123067 RepID=UPI001B800891
MLDLDSGTLVRRIDQPATYETNLANDKNGDGLNDNYDGLGYLDMNGPAEDKASFTYTADAAGTYTVSVRLASAADRPITVKTGSQAVAITGTSTGTFTNWVDFPVTLTLQAGLNTITLAQRGGAGPNIDSVKITPQQAVPDPEAIKINFQDGTTPKVAGYLVDNFLGFGDRGNGQSYGWVAEASAIDADGTKATPINGASYPLIAINERTGTGTLPNDGTLPAGSLNVNFDSYDPRLTGYAHFNHPSFPTPAAWQMAVANGWYEVTVSVGDTGGPNDSIYKLYVEGQLASDFTPTSAYKTELVTTYVKVQDGFLTLSAQGSTITEMQYLEVRALPDLTPGDGLEAPEDYADFTNPTAISDSRTATLDIVNGVLPTGIDPTSDIVLDIRVVPDRGGALLQSLTDGSIRVYETLTGAAVGYSANTSGGFDEVTISPTSDLKPFTSYTVLIDGFQDRGSNSDPNAPTRDFQKFSTTFTTGAAPAGGGQTVAFNDTVEVTSDPGLGESYTSIEMSPDKAFLYVTSMAGTITRWAVSQTTGDIIDSTKQVFAPQGDFNVPESVDNPRRGIIGLAFDPENPNVIWVTDNYPIPLDGRTDTVPDFSGRLSKVTLGAGGSLEGASIQTWAKGLPRSGGDHVTNSLEFHANPAFGQPGEPRYLLYLTQGSNTAMGEADSQWGLRPERLLNGAILEVDRSKAPPAGGFDLTTEPLPANGLNRRFADADGDLKNGGIAITSGPYQGKFLFFAEDGVATVHETSNPGSALVKAFYDPFAADAPVKIYATGTRNAYDLVWHSNGHLYAPTNGSAAGGTTPDNPDTAVDEGWSNVEKQDDYLFRIAEGRYYGHPNPLRNEFVLNHGRPDNPLYPAEVGPDPNYDAAGAYSLGENRSPNGAIEYMSNVFGSALSHALIFAQYSVGDNLRAVTLNPDGSVARDFVLRRPSGQVISYADPLDVIEGADGRLYMVTLARTTGVSQIVRLEAAASTPGATTIDATQFTVLDLDSGTLVRRI